MKTVRPCLSLFLVLFAFILLAQQPTQTIRGKVVDKESKTPLTGVVVRIAGDSTLRIGATTDQFGNYRLENVPAGRHSVQASYVGYRSQTFNNLVISSAKELILDIELEEDVAVLGEVEITARKKSDVNNEMSSASTRSFNVEETERYAGSRGDPARMASNFAGVQGSDDSRNDIVIRGNSPFGVVYRIEGVDAPNPNHFAVAGTSGGPVSILNNKMLSNSDFFTGAFPAEYGNSVSGVFDIRLRNGNNEKREYTAQFGFLGTELTAEGPMGKKGASYLANYRYSTLRLFESLNIRIGTSAVPNYQDGFIRLNFPTARGSLAFFALGGKSRINIIVSQRTQVEEEIYGDKDRDQYFGSGMGLAGMTYAHNISDRTWSRLTLAISGTTVDAHHDKVYFNQRFEVDSLKPILGYDFIQGKQMLSYALHHKRSSRHSFKTGFQLERFTANLADSVFNNQLMRFVSRVDARDDAYFVRPFAQWKWKPLEKLTVNSGVHFQYFTLNGSMALEPRVGMRYELGQRSVLTAAYGLHSQLQPLYIYYHHLEENGQYRRHNRDIGFTRSHHAVVGIEHQVSAAVRLRSEVYYQYLFNAPVETKRSAFSLLNQGTGFTRIFPSELVNKGIGRNYGWELTLDKAFSSSWFLMFTASLFQSEYQGSDGLWRSTDFNTGYAANLLLGREWKVSSATVLQLGSKTTWAGGRRYGPADIAASAVTGEVVFIDSLTNSLQFKDYFRTDLKINLRSNRKKVGHEVGLDLVNLLNTKNLLTLTYAPDPSKPGENPVKQEYQLGFLPLFYYKIDF